jgi:exodeoxyribonuclease VII large subunit
VIVQPLTVSELTSYIQDVFAADELLGDVWVEGEVTESSRSRGGHVFFTFADDDCKLPCVMFRGAAARNAYVPVAGQSCAAHGQISIYAREGRYQLYVDFVRSAGIGLAALEFELLKQQLASEGLFEPSRKRTIPGNVRTIGVVTSSEGAVWHDIATVVARRNPFVHLVLAPAAVQGDSAPQSLLAALERLLEDGRADVLIVGRGGGSASDLAAFNEEELVRAVYASPIPVVSAVGHETDWTLLDLVADVRAPTPSAAAELCTESIADRYLVAVLALERLRFGLDRDVVDGMLRVDELRDGLARAGPADQIPHLKTTVGSLVDDMRRGVEHGLMAMESRRIQERAELTGHITQHLNTMQHRKSRNDAVLRVLNPLATLARGYAALTDAKSGAPVRSALSVHDGERLIARLHDGHIESVVDSGQRG